VGARSSGSSLPKKTIPDWLKRPLFIFVAQNFPTQDRTLQKAYCYFKTGAGLVKAGPNPLFSWENSPLDKSSKSDVEN
jgi:hypothetical protein